jgi:hypothetical protein
MKTFLTSFLLCTGVSLAGTFVHESTAEFTSSGDFNGDGFSDVLIVDKASGLYRIGYGTGTGSLNFAEGRPSGVSNVTGIAVGRINTTVMDSFAITSPDQNRTQILSPTTTGVILPATSFVTGLGPQLLAAIDLPLGVTPTAEDDLVVLASRDLINQYQLRQVRSNGGAWSLLRSDDSADFSGRAGNPIVPATAAAALFAYVRDAGSSTDSFHAYSVTGTGGSAEITIPAVPKGSAFICDVFNGAEADLMFWVPGSALINVRHISPSGPGWNLTTNQVFNLGFPVAQLAAVNTPAGKRLLVRYESGSLMEVTYTGTNLDSPNYIPTAGPLGMTSGVVPMPGNNFQLLYSPGPGMASTSAVAFSNSGSGWVEGTTATLPVLKPFSAFANVLLLSDPVFRVDYAQLLQSFQVPDWTTSVTAGPPVVVDAATFGSTTSGLGTPATTTLGTPASAPGGAVVNQMHSQFSLISFNSNLGVVPDAVVISPDPGTYDTAQQIQFSGLSGGTSVYYRMGTAGAFQLWNAASPPWITRDVSVQYYSQSAGGPGAVQTAAYAFSKSPALQDADGDGVPDFVELAHGMDPTSGDDADDDGFTDRDELAAGTNPNDAGSKPAGAGSSLDAMIVDVRAQLRDVSGVVTAVAADGTHVTVSDPYGNELGSKNVGAALSPATFARVRTRAVDPKMGFLIVRTDKHFSTDPAGTNEPRGRELIGLVPALEPEVWSFATADGAIGTPTTWSWGGTNWQAGSSNWNNGPTDTQGFDASWSTLQTNANWDSAASGTWSAADWVTQFQAAANRGARPYAEITLSPGSSLGALIVGKAMAAFILERNPASTVDGSAMFFDEADALFGLRTASTTAPTASIVRTIAVLRHVDDQLGGSDLGAQALRKLARDVYAQHNALATTDLDLLPMPLDALETFVDTGTLPAAYLTATSLTPAEQSAATAKLASILATVPERSTTTQTLYVRSGTPTPGLSLANDASATAKLLLNDKIRALTLPDENEAPAGTPLQITAYTDLPSIGGYTAWEVTSLTLSSLPNVVDEDTDGDLLADSWELRHFGTLDNDGYGNRDGSLYTLMQEYFDGTDPRIGSSSPVLPPVDMVISDFDITTLGAGSFRLRARWPAAYAHAINVMMQGTPDLVEWLLPSEAADVGGGEFQATISTTDPRYFFRAFPELKR